MPVEIKDLEISGGGRKSSSFEIKIPKEGVQNSEMYKKGVAIQKNIESNSEDSTKNE